MTMTEMMTRLIEAYGSDRIGQLVPMGELAKAAGLTGEQAVEAIEALTEVMDVRLDSTPFSHQLGRVRVRQGGEWMDVLALD